MKEKGLELVELDETMMESFLDFAHALLDAGETQHMGAKLLDEIEGVKAAGIGDERTAFAAFVQRQRDCIEGKGLPEGWVPWRAFFLVQGDRILGSAGLRFELTEALRDVGGHIGFMVRPSARGQGLATFICAALCEKAQDHGLKRVLITCNAENLASARVIQKCGGVLASQSHSEVTGVEVQRYWVDLTSG
jgi:predicted acetyltransferase